VGVTPHVFIAIQEGYADEVTLHRSLSFVIPWTYKGLRDYVAEVRERDRDALLYVELERLVDKWKDGKLLSTGESAP
jgi:hypothetical protein